MTARGIQVLVVEDDPVMRSAYGEMLRMWGFQTRAVHNGLAALLEIRRAEPDIVLSDLEMPGMNGYELLSVLRRLYPEIRTIAMSGTYSGERVPPGVAADAFYAKGTGQSSQLLSILIELASAASGGTYFVERDLNQRPSHPPAAGR
ncbi:MAG TPA: response regulator [Acidobacteriaceae bacterium]|jgi:CheY-like chemotaxis protein